MNAIDKRRKNFKDRLQKEKNGEYRLIGEYTRMRDKTEILHTVCGHKWEVSPHTLMRSKQGCPYCANRNKASTTEEFINALKERQGDIFELAEGEEYYNNRKPIKMIHKPCGKTLTASPTTLLSNGACPHCPRPSSKKKTTEEFERELYDTHGEEYILSDNTEYTGANEKIGVIHTECGHEWEVRAAHILYRSGCPNCNKSKGESYIAKLLEEIDIPFEREYTFPDCVNKKELPFDFAILDRERSLRLLIEYDGVQHFKPFKHFGGVEKFKKQKKNDRIKDTYCRNNGIKLLRIPYTMGKQEIEETLKELLVEK